MAAPIVSSARASRVALTRQSRVLTSAAPSRKGAAMARRTKPTSSGSAAAPRARSVMVTPVVPQEIAASAMRTRPVSTVPHYTDRRLGTIGLVLNQDNPVNGPVLRADKLIE